MGTYDGRVPDRFAPDRFPADQQGRCWTCGFASKHHPVGLWREITATERKTGFYWVEDELGQVRAYSPQCIVWAFNLAKEHTARAEQLGHPEEAAKAILHADRNCVEWFPYQSGLSPKDHLEHQHMLQLEEQRRELQVRLTDIERKAAADSAQIQRDSLEITRNLARSSEAAERIASDSHDYNRRWTRVFVVFAVLSFLVSVLALSYPQGIDWGLTLRTWWEWMPWTTP